MMRMLDEPCLRRRQIYALCRCPPPRRRLSGERISKTRRRCHTQTSHTHTGWKADRATRATRTQGIGRASIVIELRRPRLTCTDVVRFCIIRSELLGHARTAPFSPFGYLNMADALQVRGIGSDIVSRRHDLHADSTPLA